MRVIFKRAKIPEIINDYLLRKELACSTKIIAGKRGESTCAYVYTHIYIWRVCSCTTLMHTKHDTQVVLHLYASIVKD